MDEIATADARQLTDRIKVAIEGTWQLIQEAYVSRAWAALGYSTWDDYCTREFGSSRLRLPREERQEVVGSLRDAGLSTRAIAAATGLNQSTISRELSSGDANASPATPIRGTDGKSYAPSRPAPPRPLAAPTKASAAKSDWTPAPVAAVPSGQVEIVDAEIIEELDVVAQDARRDAELDAELSGTVQRFRANFSRARLHASEIVTFDPDRTCEVYASNWDREVGDYIQRVRSWCDRVEAAHRRQSTGLRIVGGAR